MLRRFTDIGRWQILADFKDPEWSRPYFSGGWIRLWFGHPQLAARRDGGNVWLAPDNDTDKFPVRPQEGADIVSVPAAALSRAIDEAFRVMTAIEARLDQALTGVLPDHLRAPAIDLMLNGANRRATMNCGNGTRRKRDRRPAPGLSIEMLASVRPAPPAPPIVGSAGACNGTCF